jgi:hypothetical protein
MIDTLMALWNQDRRKRAVQVILTFFVMCISISLLFVIAGRPAESQHQNQKASIASSNANPTVPTFGSTVVPELTPTISVVVGTQPKSISTSPSPSASSTSSTSCNSASAGTTRQTSALYADVTVLQTASPTPGATPGVTPTPHASGTAKPNISTKPNDGGGGPITPGTPVVPTPTYAPLHPTATSAPRTQHTGGGWVSNCTTSNSISNVVDTRILGILVHNMWLILGGSLLGTVAFYAFLFVVKRRVRA